MNTQNIKMLTLAISLAFSSGVQAESMTKNDYQAGKDAISADYKSARSACNSLSGNPNDICVAEAKGREKVAFAELEAGYKPTVKNSYDLRVARAEASYAVAKEKCDDLAGNGKDVCIKEAKSAEIARKADARTKMRTSDANAMSDEQSADARSKASDKVIDARKDASQDKAEAAYQVEKEKCGMYAGGAKDQCLDQAKGRFGKM